MKQRSPKTLALLAVLATVLSTGCAKKVAKVQPPAAPPAPATPTATLAANPNVIQQGQQTTLTWQTSNASDITIAGLGTLSASGSRTITPSASTTYTLVAKGPGGTSDASTRVTVNAAVASATPAPSDEDLFARNVKDVYFDYDKSDIRPNEVGAQEGNAAFLAQHPNLKVLVEGHCDDRGSVEYNLALGTSRAESVKRSLEQQGVPATNIQTISYGKEKPFCTQDNEQCWQENRVGHFVFQR
ncbi:MAG: peptidoglycan-associated lipoprotein Pal [Terriglobales bacterium]